MGAPAAKEGKDWPDATIGILVVTGKAPGTDGESAVTLSGFAVSCGESGCELEEGPARLDAGAAALDFRKTVQSGVPVLVNKAAFVIGGDADDEGLVPGAVAGLAV